MLEVDAVDDVVALLVVVVVLAAEPLPEVAWELHWTTPNAMRAIAAMMATIMAAIFPPLFLGAGWKLRGFLDWAE